MRLQVGNDVGLRLGNRVGCESRLGSRLASALGPGVLSAHTTRRVTGGLQPCRSSVTCMNAPAARSRRQIAAATGVPIGLLRSLENDGLLHAGALTVHDEIVVRALTWADGARGGDRAHEQALAASVRAVLDAGTAAADLLLVLVDGQVITAADPLEALLAMRGRRGVVTLLPVGAWASASGAAA